MSDALEASTSRTQALRAAVELLREAGIAEASGDARILVEHALGLTRTELVLQPDAAIGEAGAAALDAVLRRRYVGEPVARILGEWEFWGLPFALSPETLVPRPDTETLAEAALALVPDRDRPMRLLDLGTGSGCILVALLHECRNAFGIGSDRSEAALATARSNARRNGVTERAAFVRGDWCAPFSGPFDLIVSNPPYIASAVIEGLSTEVREHDPRAALDGGADGLHAYRAILRGIAARPGLLAPCGAVLFEIGHDQQQSLAALSVESGFRQIRTHRDLAGRDRVVTLRPPFDATCTDNDVV